MSSIFDRPEPGTRKPRHTREQIAAAALAIADREGFDAVSMRRVAQEVGAGTMTLYHYVRTKSDLIELMDDAIMGEVLIPDGELPATWREAVRMIACSSHAAFVRHPWALRAMTDSNGGPNGMRHFEQSLAAVSSLEIGTRARLELMGIVDDYVFGYVFRTAEVTEAFKTRATEELIDDLLPHFQTQIHSGEYPHIEALFGGRDTRETWNLVVDVMTAESRFEHGLDLLLDGIEAKLASGTPWGAGGED